MNPRNVWIRLGAVDEGMFPSEKTVQIETTDGKVSLFVARSTIEEGPQGARMRGALLDEDQQHALIELSTQQGSNVLKIRKSEIRPAS